MGFIVGLIVNVVMLSVPIGGTLGTLFAIRPFENERRPETPELNDIFQISACNKFNEFAHNKFGQNYTVNSNEVLPAPGSTLCLAMTTHENATYPTNSSAPPFAMTWEYPVTIANKSAPANQTQFLAHAFPQAIIAPGGLIPMTLADLGALNVNVEWTMGTGDAAVSTTSFRRLSASEVNATVALNMYIDTDKAKAADAGSAGFQMLVYFAKLGLQRPVGFGIGTIAKTETLNGKRFDLFAGKNSNKQNVFSWIPAEPLTEFRGDLSPLFDSILRFTDTKKFQVDIPPTTAYLGYVGFGTQVYSSIGKVTFAVPKMEIDIRRFGT